MNALLVFHLVSAIASVGVAIGTLEYLVILPQFATDSIFSWKIFGTKLVPARYRTIDTVRNRLLDRGGVRAMMIARLGAAVIMAVPTLPVAATATAALVVFLTGVTLTYRCGFGEDGSDQMLTIVAAGLCAFAVLPASSPWRPMGLWFIGAQGVLSYVAAGYAKVVSPVWRNGDASLLIFRTMTYSTAGIARVLQRSHAARIFLAWSTIAFECLFPVVLYAPRPVAFAFLALGCTFHFLNAAVMGLNIFFWAFTATYPAILLVRQSIMK